MSLFRIFRIKREERWLSLFTLLYLTGLHALVICKYYELFTPIKKYYWPLFIRNFHVSGFDPITYSIVSDWTAGYNVYRHPFLAFFMYIPYQLNQLLIELTGKNCAIFVVALMQMFFGFYAIIFFYRIVREVVELGYRTACLLTLFFMSFAYVMVSAMVPDHFIISMMLLLLALYIAGICIKKGVVFKTWQMVLYFMLTAGVSLNNGLKIFLASLFVNKKKFFRPMNLLLGVIVPSLLIWGFCRWEYRTFVWPKEVAQQKANKKKKEAKRKKDYQMRIEQQRKDSLLLAKGDTATVEARKAKLAADEKKKAEAGKKRGPKQGTPISKGEFMRWTDITSSRADAIVENMLGESIQLHSEYLLDDVLRSRPMVVRYSHWWNYMVEAVVAILFFVGLWAGRRSRFLWLVMSFFGMDFALHVGLGFGINEIYIMSAHWIYAIPIAIAFVPKMIPERRRPMFAVMIGVLAAYLFIYNMNLLLEYFI